MYYKILPPFGPNDSDRWHRYIAWRGLKLTRFDSVDGILRPAYFLPQTEEDWMHCVNENFKLNLLTDEAYARQMLRRYDEATLAGVEIELETDYQPKDRLLGYDIIDGYCDVSLLTNWGADEEGLFTNHIMSNGLIGDIVQAIELRNKLRRDFAWDAHAIGCHVWAVYDPRPIAPSTDHP